jgi:undecaprenyl-diphosphatase
MIFATELGGVAAMTLLAVVGAFWQASLQNRVLAFGWIGILIGCAILNNGSKRVFDRERPPEAIRDQVVHEVNRSYPSGHAMGSAIGLGMLAYCLCVWQRNLGMRVLIVLVTLGVVAAIGFSRFYLRAHWFSDVIGGWCLGLTWLFFCLGCLERWRSRPLAA